MLLEAIDAAITDAGIGRSDIDGVITEAMLTPPVLPVDKLAPALGLDSLRYQGLSSPVGAGILLAVAQAHAVVEAGLARHVLTYFGVDWGTHGSGPAGIHGAMDAKREVEYPVGFSGPPLYFATMATRYAHQYGLQPAELEELLCQIAVSARRNAQRHCSAQARDDLGSDAYRAQPYVAQPLRRADISLLSDGAVAMVVSADSAVPGEKAVVTLAGWGHAVQPLPDEAFYTQSRELPRLPATAAAATQVADRAGQEVSSADMFELYDCFSVATAVQLEALGITGPGSTLEGIAGGQLEVGGTLPTNTHGGLLSHGYLLGAGHVTEAVRQLRHEALGNQVADAATAFVGAGPGRQYTGLLFRRTDV
ncbi:thiolase family protein [Geodermatophilus sp. CPCC 205506]|uniref:thiolase family protein n=1 Tax=Geodermatophilus sp. CPCC 205506 TaxID=2936596 RepID=UPI003EEF9518